MVQAGPRTQIWIKIRDASGMPNFTSILLHDLACARSLTHDLTALTKIGVPFAILSVLLLIILRKESKIITKSTLKMDTLEWAPVLNKIKPIT